MEIYETVDLQEMILEVQPQNQFLLTAFFPDVVLFDDEYIAFDVVTEAETLAPFVSPCTAGKPMKDEGYTTKLFKPAYVKPKHVVEPCKTIKRRAGEAIGGNLSAEERFDADLGEKLGKQERMIQRRLEWMAAQALETGKVIVNGEDYPETEVDFGRDPGNTIQLAGGAAWDQATSTPLQDIEDWSQIVLEGVGVGAADLVFTPSAWKLFIKNQDVNDLLDSRRGVDNVPFITPAVASKSYYKGELGNFRCWVYDGTFVDENGAKQKMLSDNLVLCIAQGEDGINGKQAFGAIKDCASLNAAERFPKMWEQQDPSVCYVMTQSAPLVIPTRPNAVVAATVV